MEELAAGIGGAGYVLGELVKAGREMGLAAMQPWLERRKNSVMNDNLIERAQARREERLIDEKTRLDILSIQSGKARLTANGTVEYLSSNLDPNHKQIGSANADNFTGLLAVSHVQAQLENLEKLLNLREVVRLAEEIVEAKHSKETSQTPVGRDWLMQFKAGAEVNSDEDMRSLWANLLVAEIDTPGSQSLRTINTLKLLSPSEAKLFAKLAPFIIDNSYFFMDEEPLLDFTRLQNAEINRGLSGTNFLDDAGITYSVLLHLKSIGLINLETMSAINREPTELPIGGNGWTFNFNNKLILVVINPKEGSLLKLPANNITQTGRDILKLGDFEPSKHHINLLASYMAHFNPQEIRLVQVQVEGDRLIPTGDGELLFHRDSSDEANVQEFENATKSDTV